MPSFSSFTIIGNLTANPEMRDQPSGAPICTFAVAVNSRRKDAEGKAVDHVDFFRITTKFKLAEVCNKFLKKGRSVFVTGDLESWRNEGKFGINFVASNVQFLGGSKDAGAGDEHGQNQAGNQDGWDEETREWARQLGGDMPN